MFKDDLIKQYHKIHSEKLYGCTSERLLHLILPYIKEINPESILDYGCGQSQLAEMIQKEIAADKTGIINIYKYDPAIDEYSSLPKEKVDLVICTDVLEHVPPEDVDGTIKEIVALGENCFFVICTKEAIEILPNGENAHCSVHDPAWWLSRIEKSKDFAKKIPWPVNSSCAIITWDSYAVGGLLDSLVKFLSGHAERLFKKS